MLLTSLRAQVLAANQEISRRGLAPHTFGNASGIDRSGAQPLVVIKPSGVDYATMTAEDLVVTDLDGNIVEGKLHPSSDLDTHTLLYREFPQIGGIVHTHSEFATSWAQAGREIPCLGTTHADYFHGPVPVTSVLSTSTRWPSLALWSPDTPPSPGAKPPWPPSKPPTCSNTSPGWPSAASCSERPKMGFRCTFPNTITSASTAPRPPTDKRRKVFRVKTKSFRQKGIGISKKQPFFSSAHGAGKKPAVSFAPVIRLFSY
jgi:hypothetical protein